jgi:hypothetical protein
VINKVTSEKHANSGGEIVWLGSLSTITKFRSFKKNIKKKKKTRKGKGSVKIHYSRMVCTRHLNFNHKSTMQEL